MSSKIKRNFLIAAKNDENWFRAVSEQELARRHVAPEDALFVPQALNGANVLTAPDKFNLVSIAANKSEGVKNDLAEAVAAQIVARADALPKLIASLGEAELEYRSSNLSTATWAKLYDQNDGKDYDRLTNDIGYLRSLPDESYRYPEIVAALGANVKAGGELTEIMQDAGKQPADKQKAVADVLKTLDGRSVLKWASSYGFHFGDRFNEWDGPTREEAKVYFDVAKSLMKHWDEAGTSPNGKPYDAFAAGQNGSRSVYIRKEYVQKIKP